MPTPDPIRAARRRRHAPLPLALLTLALLRVHGAAAQDVSDTGAGAAGSAAANSGAPPLVLKRSPGLTETLPRDQRGQLPSFIEGDSIHGQPDLNADAEGHATLRRGDLFIRADRLDYDQADDLAKARGNVHLNQAGNVYEGPELQLKTETFEGFFNDVQYQLLRNGAVGHAARVDFLDQDRSVARNATYTTCRRDDLPGWTPAWIMRASELRTNTEENEGEAVNPQMNLFGMALPPLPFTVSFPLGDDRKTGLLPPIIGMGSINGFEYMQPWYWNIAPNRDATFTPDFMSKRGINLSSEFRYLEKDYKGEIRLDYMPTDQLRDQSRWGLWSTNSATFDAKRWGLDSLTGTLNVNRVSDDFYWEDFTNTPSLTNRLLSSDATLNWTKGDWSGLVRAQDFQTLQVTGSTVVPPYNRLPQITANYNKYDWNGFDIGLTTDVTRFQADQSLEGQPNATREYVGAQISRPFLWPGAYITPKLLLHATDYQYDAPLASTGQTSASVVVPSFSLDSGMTFERDTSYFGRAFTQTLEPRLFYVYTPYRNQSQLPVYDTSAYDYSFATVFNENEFSGQDRVSATNAVTAGVTSRLIDPDTGAEAVRLSIAQRYRFSDQDVTIPDTPAGNGGTVAEKKGWSDLLLGAQINWTPRWSLDTTIQYNQQTRTSDRDTVTLSYKPEPYHVINLSYRYQSDAVAGAANATKLVDLSWQWPLNDLWGDRGRKDLGPGRGEGGGRWYAVGRLNYDMLERKLADGVLGVEYDGCCYIARVVLQDLTTGLTTPNKRIMFQLEFVGFSSVGTSPLLTLRQNIPGYLPLRLPVQAPSRFTNYE